MLRVDFDKLVSVLPGQQVDRPNKASRGELSGHAAGEPFEKRVYQDLKELYPGKIFKQHEYLNDIFLNSPQHISNEDRCKLMGSPTALFLLCRGEAANSRWSPLNLFEERQNDTADILFYIPGYWGIIDVKTRNLDKRAQPPNIISSYKLAQMCGIMIDNNEYDTIGLDYIGIDWQEDSEAGVLVCQNAQHVDLFKTTPSDLYINWSAALQIQFKLTEIAQDWRGSREEWVRAYLRHYVDEARKRLETFESKFITPFLKYL